MNNPTPSGSLAACACAHRAVAAIVVALVAIPAARAAVLDGGGAPDPTFSGFYAWYDAGAGVIEGDGSAAEQGDNLLRWEDQTGNGRHLDRIVATGPALQEDVQNGQSVVRFANNGAIWDDSGSWGNISQPNTVFVVTQANVLAGDYIFDSSSTAGRNALLAGQTSNLTDWQPFAGSVLTSSEIVTGALQSHTLTFNGASSAHTVNGQLQAAGNTGTQSLAGLILGARVNTANQLDGDIAEVLVYNTALTAAEQRQVEGYLAAKYNLLPPVSADLYAHYDASNGVVASGGPAADGERVVVWEDQSGNGRDLDRLIGAGPQFEADGLNGQPTVEFLDDGAIWDDSGSWGNLAQPNTIFVVARADTLNGDYVFDSSSGAGRNALFAGQTSNPTDWQSFAGGVVAGDPIATGEFLIQTVVFDSTSSKIFVGGIEVASGDAGTQFLAGLVLGGRFSATRLLDGAIAEVIVYDGILAGPEQVAVSRYLGQKYGLFAVPEPATCWLVALSLSLLLGRWRRRRPG